MIKKLNKIWDYYNNKAVSLFRFIEVSIILRNIKKKKYFKILDIGCGDGFISRTIFPKAHITALDNDEAKECSIAKKNKIINDYIIQDARKAWKINLNLKYDLIFSNSVLEHIPKIEKVFFQSSKLKKKHDFIFTVPNANFTYNLFPSIFYKIFLLKIFFNYVSELRSKQLNHYNANSKKFWTDLLHKYGYKLIKSESYMSPTQLNIWNINVILYRFFKINFIKKPNDIKLLSSKEIKNNCCNFFHFRKN